MELIGYRGFLQKEYEDDPAEQEARWDCVEQMVNALADHERSAKKPHAAGSPDFAVMVRGFLDELVLDVPDAEQVEVERLVRDAMVGAAKLHVPLEVAVGHGRTWLSAH